MELVHVKWIRPFIPHKIPELKLKRQPQMTQRWGPSLQDFCIEANFQING